MKRRLVLGACALPCLLVYLCRRTEATVVNRLAESVLGAKWHHLLAKAAGSLVPTDSFAVYSAPEGLWIFVLTAVSRGGRAGRIPLEILPPLYAASLEGLQALGWIRGRADGADLAAALAGWTSAVFWTGPGPVWSNRRWIVAATLWAGTYLAHVQR